MAGDKLSDKEVHDRVMEAYRLRYLSEKPIRQEDWVKHCHEIYGDKSEQQYCQYFTKARDVYEGNWKEKLHKMLDPATRRIEDLLNSDNPNDYKEGVRMVYKYTGNEIDKSESKVEQNTTIKVKFGRD